MKTYCGYDELNKIMFGDQLEHCSVRVAIKWVGIALFRYIKVIRIYHKGGLIGVIGYIHTKEYNKNLDWDALSDNQKVYLMRRYMIFFRICGKIFRESWNCLLQACTLFTALYTIGFEVDLVIGKFVYFASENYQFHAWVEYKGIPINDKGSVYERCLIVYRLQCKKIRAALLESSLL